MKLHNEQKLLARIKKGDDTAFGRVYDWYVNQIYKFVYLKVDDASASEEIVQDVFWKLWQYLRDAPAEERVILNLRAWLYRSARNSVADYYRSFGKTPALFSIESSVSESISGQDESDLVAEIDHRIEMFDIEKALEQLPLNYREAILMRFMEDMEYAEMAEILGKDPDSLRVLVYRALKSLKKVIGTEQNDE